MLLYEASFKRLTNSTFRAATESGQRLQPPAGGSTTTTTIVDFSFCFARGRYHTSIQPLCRRNK